MLTFKTGPLGTHNYKLLCPQCGTASFFVGLVAVGSSARLRSCNAEVFSICMRGGQYPSSDGF